MKLEDASHREEKEEDIIKLAPVAFPEDSIFSLRAKITRRGRRMKIGTKVAKGKKGEKRIVRGELDYKSF